MKSFIPQRLQEGDLIGVVSPASPPHDNARIARGISYLLSRGFRVRIGNGVGIKSGYFAGSDRVRRQDVEAMFADEQVRAILCSRGGYGSARLLETLDWDVIRNNHKIFAGFSDITALSMGLFAECGLMTFAGPMVAAEFADVISPVAENAFWEMLMQPQPQRELQAGNAVRTIRAGRAEGQLLGGNLSVLCSLIGSPYLPRFAGSILFIEDVGEQVYRIDRMLLQLKYSGILKQVAGVVLGSFTAVPPAPQDRDLDEVFEEYLLPLNVPIIAGFPFGHIKDKITLPIGAWVMMDGGKGALVVSHPVVR